MANMRLGGSGRFQKLEGQLAARGARNPGALAAYIGRKKYGKTRFQQLSSGRDKVAKRLAGK